MSSFEKIKCLLFSFIYSLNYFNIYLVTIHVSDLCEGLGITKVNKMSHPSGNNRPLQCDKSHIWLSSSLDTPNPIISKSGQLQFKYISQIWPVFTIFTILSETSPLPLIIAISSKLAPYFRSLLIFSFSSLQQPNWYH